MLHASSNSTNSEYNLIATIPHDIDEDPGLNLISEETFDCRVHIPPPRIAARFYRPTASRRKKSAASSRRGSISSVHSHQSTTWPEEPQSSFVAQHQRRAFIIENRKARLADRAAHAEKVRLRAAFYKATPRSTVNSEERALAVQQARERNLAEIVAACAEEVKRAKGIAESIKEKREADGKKLRKDMEDRLAEAEKRREEILNRGSNMRRSHSLSQSQKDQSTHHKNLQPLSVDAAVFRIQRSWRIRQARKAIKEFVEIGLNIETVAQKSFFQIASLLKQDDVILTTARLLRICGLKEIDVQSRKGLTVVKTFLSAYLIIAHPEQTLINKAETQDLSQLGSTLHLKTNDLDNSQIQSLMAKARDMLISFEKILSRLQSVNPPLTCPNELPEAYASFSSAFVAWKARDSEGVADVLLLQFTELEKIWLSIKDSSGENTTDSDKDGIRESQISLFASIKRLAGEKRAREMISQALREAHSSRPRKKPSTGAQIRTKKSAEPRKLLDDSFEKTERVMAAALHTLAAPSPPEKNTSSLVDAIRYAQPVMHENRIITHEIAIDKTYRIGEEVLTGKNFLMQSAFDNMRKSIAAGNSEVWVLAMAENVRTKLQRLLTEGKPMHASIGEWLDHDHISAQLQHRSFSYDKFFDEMAQLLPKLCAPVRDEEIQAIIREKFRDSDVVSRLEALIYALDILQLDYANFLLQRQIPMILSNAASYEKYQFMYQLAEGKCSLQATENAWKSARTKVIAEISRRDPANMHRIKPTVEKIYGQMLVDVFTVREDETKIPETLLLDKQRIFRIRDEVFRIVTCSAILLQCKNLLKRDVRSSWKIEATRIYMVLENSKSPEQARLGIQAALESCRSMPMITKDHIRSLVDQTITASDSTHQPNDAVLLLLMSRLRSHILSRISARNEKEKAKSMSTANENLVTLGFPEFSQKVGDIVQEIGRVAAVDREAHTRWYEQIIQKFDALQAENSEKMDVDVFSAS
ncbi:hypothetical protein K3495_g8431 [Podosphaera aphanis]|nr:hypothetical protein K3495_g8431 [Podosphaera aphanis]